MGQHKAVLVCCLLSAGSGVIGLAISRTSGLGAVSGLVIALIGALALGWVFGKVRVYDRSAGGLRRVRVRVKESVERKFLGIKLKWWKRAAWVGLPVLVFLGVTLVPAVSGARLLVSGRQALTGGKEALVRGDMAGAVSGFQRAEAAFVRARSRLRVPPVRVAGKIPWLGNNVRVAGGLAEGGYRLALAGEALSQKTEALTRGLGLRAGTVDLKVAQSALPALEAADPRVVEARRLVSATPSNALIGAVASAREEALKQITDAERLVSSGEELVRALPALLGDDRPKRYFLAIENLAEARATGGFIGSYGILDAVKGKVSLTHLGFISELGSGVFPGKPGPTPEFQKMYERFGGAAFWHNINMSPDFPTVATNIEKLFPIAVAGGHLDGVVSVDPVGLACLMTLTGPVKVEDLSQPLTAEEVVRFTLSTAYSMEPRPAARKEMLGVVAGDVWAKLLSINLSAERLARSFAPAVEEGHLKFHSADTGVQKALERLGVAGKMTGAAADDAVMLVTQNASGNKMDYYMRRALNYRVSLGMDGSAQARAAVDLANTGPASGLPAYVAGPRQWVSVPGEDRLFVSLYVPISTGLSKFTGGTGTTAESMSEGDRAIYSRFVAVAPQSATSLVYELASTKVVSISESRGSYRLAIGHQPTIVPDKLHLEIVAPQGMHIDSAPGLKIVDGGSRAIFDGEIAASRVVEVRYSRPFAGRVLDRLAAWFGPPA